MPYRHRSLALSLSALGLLVTTGLARADEGAAPAPGPGPAQPEPARPKYVKEGAAVAFDLHRFQDSFGVGGAVSSPTLLGQLRLTLGGGISFYSRVPDDQGKLSWKAFPYGTATVEVGPAFAPGAVVRPYGFGGVIVSVLPTSLASDAVALGGLGGFGLEARFTGPDHEAPVTYFFELGGIGSGAHVDKLATNENVLSGFLVRAGVKFYP